MPDNFIVNRGKDSIIKVQNKMSGSMWVSEDRQTLYFDSRDGQTRIQITDIIDLSKDEPTEYYENKIYIDGKQLKKYNTSTNQLEIISSLENDVITDNIHSFEYAAGSLTSATLQNESKPLKGTIVIDKNGDVGVTLSSTQSDINVVVVGNNSFKNIHSNYDFYIDSNYDGVEVGTFEHPFISFDNLVNHYGSILANDSFKTIHIKTNSNNMDVYIADYKNTHLKFEKFSSYGEIIIVDSTNVQISNLNCDKLNITPTYEYGKYELVNSSVTEFSYIDEPTEITGLSDLQIEMSNIDNLVVSSNMCELNIINCNITANANINCKNLNLLNSQTNQIETNCTNNLKLYNNTIIQSVNTAPIISFDRNNIVDSIQITADEISLGTTNFNGNEPIFSGLNVSNPNIKYDSGLSSIQVYDKNNNRGYDTPDTPDLKSHLDSIGDKFEEINEKLSGTDSITNAFLTKDTFATQNEISGNYRIGDVLTCRNNTGTDLSFEFNLENGTYTTREELDPSTVNYMGEVDKKIDLPILGVNIGDTYLIKYTSTGEELNQYKTYTNTGWEDSVLSEVWYYEFTLENAKYYISNNDFVDLFDYFGKPFTDQTIEITRHKYITIPVNQVYSSGNSEVVKCKIFKNKLKENIVKDLEVLLPTKTLSERESLADDLLDHKLNTAQTSSRFIQVLKLNYKDRILRLSNGWDKLSSNISKELQEQIDNLKSRGRFLSLWNCATGTPLSNPLESPYEYKTGDYFIINNIAEEGSNNYKPSGTQYVIGGVSTVIESDGINIDDIYYYDGQSWTLQQNSQKIISFSNIVGNATDNWSLATELQAKVDKIAGKGLSTNDFSNEEKAKLDTITIDTSEIVFGDGNKRVTIDSGDINANGSLSADDVYAGYITVDTGEITITNGNSMGTPEQIVFYDIEGKDEKTLQNYLDEKSDKTSIETNTQIAPSEFTLAHNKEYRFTNALTGLDIAVPDNPQSDFISSIVFISGSTATNYTYPDGIIWTGDDLTDGQFVPKANRRYTLVVWYDGVWNGAVRGVKYELS